jgi:hypothetical protein
MYTKQNDSRVILINNNIINESVCFWKHSAFSKHKDNQNVFIETGTHIGGGIANALAINFNKIYSIEINKDNYNIAKDRWKHLNNVNLYCGDTSQTIESILNTIDESVFFWLDAHFDVGPQIPTYKELEFIGNHHIKNHTILVDDVSLYFDFKQLEEAIKNINPDYVISYEPTWRDEKDILVAKIIK